MKMKNVWDRMWLQLRNHESAAFAHTLLCHDSKAQIPDSIQGERSGSLPPEKLI